MVDVDAGTDWSLVRAVEGAPSAANRGRYSPRARLLIVLVGAVGSWALLILPTLLLLQ